MFGYIIILITIKILYFYFKENSSQKWKKKKKKKKKKKEKTFIIFCKKNEYNNLDNKKKYEKIWIIHYIFSWI